jgi:(1->4)-alpha-D-glucan 1-alpha-D-glucosylmutase
VLNLQQVSGPVAAKGVEDTAFYRYYPLASLNEVGGEIDARPLAVEEFHRLMRHRAEAWPHSLSATATHDAKRGEDFRARLHVLSEAADEWTQTFRRWREMNRPLIRDLDGDPVPDVNEEYLLYQTLVGTWPHEPLDDARQARYRDRILQYMEKALREAKTHTSWMNPAEAYDAAVRDFIGDLFGERGRAFLADLNRFVRQIADSGYVNSLAQLLLKMTLPGVPDFYQGTELWDFSLVDPDNRRPVDFDARRRSLRQLDRDGRDVAMLTDDLSRRWPHPDIKLWVTSCGLSLRRRWSDLFSYGEYLPLTSSGDAADHLVGFARRFEQNWLVAVVPRHFYRLAGGRHAQPNQGVPQADWAGTRLALPDEAPTMWRCGLSGRSFDANGTGAEPGLDPGELFALFPVALLTSESR